MSSFSQLTDSAKNHQHDQPNQQSIIELRQRCISTLALKWNALSLYLLLSIYLTHANVFCGVVNTTSVCDCLADIDVVIMVRFVADNLVTSTAFYELAQVKREPCKHNNEE